MEIIYSTKPLLAILVSQVAALLIILTGEKNKNLRDTWTLLAALSKFLIIFSMLPIILDEKIIDLTLIKIYPDLKLQLRVDTFGIFFGLLSSFLWIITSFYSIGYTRSLKEKNQTLYFFCFCICLSATIGIAFSANLFTFFIFYEILTVATYPLVVHARTKEAIQAGRKYLIYTLSGGVFLLFSAVLTYFLSGSTSFVPGGFLKEEGNTRYLQLLFITFIIGCGVKSAIMPLHLWLPSAMIAPIPVSALLHAVAVVKSGVFGILRIIFYVFGENLLYQLNLWIVFAWFVSFTIVVASLFALSSDNLKRRLAFSTISQLSYIILGAALLSTNGILGSIVHLANHAFLKITLFFCAGAIYIKTKKENVSELQGIGKQMPVTMIAFSLCAMGLVGIPPTNGFISKWYLCLGTIQAGEILFLGVFLISSLLNVFYFFPIIYNSFFRYNGYSKFNEAPPLIIVPILICVVFSLLLGFFPDFFFNFFQLSKLTVELVK